MGDDKPVEMKIEASGSGTIKNVIQAVIQHLTLGINYLPTDYSTRIGNFILQYTGTPESPVPFGGREGDLQKLDDWLAADGPPYLLLAAPAGRGKSALLVRWLQRLREREPDLLLVFVPVSLRVNTASQVVFFAALSARLAHLYGEKVPADLSYAPDVWRSMVSSFLSQPSPHGRLLVVLDGLDEATDWQAGPDLFPFQPPRGLHVVVSARYLAGDRGAEGWLRRLEWERPDLACTLDLDPLTREGVADVLLKMGFPLDCLGRRVDIVAELHRLSEGDPLLVRLYVDDLWQRGEEAARLQPEDLQELKPGLEGYFDRWWEDQRKQWGDEAPLREQTVREVLNLLAAALAPLGQDDVLSLSTAMDTWALEEALRPLKRLVVGDGRAQGYAFSHPRLGQYFWEKLSPKERKALEERFLAWGRTILEALKKGECAPRAVSPYLVRALGNHLARAGATPEEWLQLVDGVWAAAGEALEGDYSLFIHDVERAWRVCTLADGEKAARDELAPYLGGEVRCALVEASIHSLAGNLPPELLVELVRGGVWQARQALTYARQIPAEGARAEALAALAPHLEPDLRAQALAEALQAARGIWDEGARAGALAALAPHLEPALLAEALQAARGIWDEYSRAEALAALAPHLEPALLAEALQAARGIWDEYSRAEALAALAPHLAALPQPHLYPLWAETLPLLARRTRSNLLADLRALQPVIFALGGTGAVAEAFRAIQDVGRWWP
nr:ATP-binding protein [Chloroflexota bacterium]